jgi:hypothetical protein
MKILGLLPKMWANEAIVAYSIIKCGYLAHDKDRWTSYGYDLDAIKCCTFAPSVTDNWQGIGIGKAHVTIHSKRACGLGIQRVILWGGASM